ncbi:hypothetical protein Xph01_32520 [Micromonospora phaseoli]|nr:hypothetical protein Xph01_32520 [Micromonospora phaseoli]
MLTLPDEAWGAYRAPDLLRARRSAHRSVALRVRTCSAAPAPVALPILARLMDRLDARCLSQFGYQAAMNDRA